MVVHTGVKLLPFPLVRSGREGGHRYLLLYCQGMDILIHNASLPVQEGFAQFCNRLEGCMGLKNQSWDLSEVLLRTASPKLHKSA